MRSSFSHEMSNSKLHLFKSPRVGRMMTNNPKKLAPHHQHLPDKPLGSVLFFFLTWVFFMCNRGD